MRDQDFDDEEFSEGPQWRRIVLPLLMLVVVVGLVSALVFAGVVRPAPGHSEAPSSTTTTPTVKITL